MAGDISKKLDAKVKQMAIGDTLGNIIVTSKKLRDQLNKKDPVKAKAGLKTGGRAGLKGGTFPGDFENFTKSKEYKQAKAENLSTYKKAKEHPVEKKDAGYKFLMAAGPKEVKAFKKYRERTAKTRDEAKTQKMAKGGRAGYRMGGKCKLAKRGKGRAYGKNS